MMGSAKFATTNKLSGFVPPFFMPLCLPYTKTNTHMQMRVFILSQLAIYFSLATFSPIQNPDQIQHQVS